MHDTCSPGDDYRVTIHVVSNLPLTTNQRLSLVHGPHTKGELMFLCQWEVGNTVNGHHVQGWAKEWSLGFESVSLV